MVDVLAAIPARMGSSRFPNKPLKPIDGKPMIWHVWQRTILSGVCDDIVIATCDEEIKAAAEGFGAKVCMTSPTHSRANDRVAEVASKIPCKIILNIQGDEPLLNPQLIKDIVRAAKAQENLTCISPVSEIKDEAELNNVHTIKVAFDLNGKVVYFSRCPIPSDSVVKREHPGYRQVPLLAFESAFCQKLSSLPEGPFEIQEGTDLLRAVEHDLPVYILKTEYETIGVDIPSDLDAVDKIIQSDAIYEQYKDKSLTKV